jgi:hypothetical protein
VTFDLPIFAILPDTFIAEGALINRDAFFPQAMHFLVLGIFLGTL